MPPAWTLLINAGILPTLIMIVGDFNINYLDLSGCEYKRFVNILDTFDFVQNIELPTHSSGHLLDYVITTKNSSCQLGPRYERQLTRMAEPIPLPVNPPRLHSRLYHHPALRTGVRRRIGRL